VLYQHRGRIVRCLICGLVRRDPIPLPEDLLDLYRAHYFRRDPAGVVGYLDYFAEESVYRPYFRRKMRVLGRFISPPGALLEVGAAAGFALAEAKIAGWYVQGLELSPEAARFAFERYGVPVRVGGINDIEANAQWDVIVAFQTIEHLSDVRCGVRSLREALRPKGILFLTMPDHESLTRKLFRRFWVSYTPEHLTYFDRRAIARLLSEEGFKLELVSADDPLRVPLQRLVARTSYCYVGREFHAPFLPNVSVPVWLGDMQVVARRSE
jgi:SAM-dependent methyltransferase